MSFEWYTDFVHKGYVSKADEIKALFYYEPMAGMPLEEVVGRLASESSIGTWTTLSKLPDRIRRMMGRVYLYDSTYAYISYPKDLWETGSIPQLLSGIGGNIFGMKAVKSLKLLDAYLPNWYVKSFKGPVFGQSAIRSIFKRKKGPITATVPKPKLGFTSREHAEIALELWLGGLDCVKDDENLTNQNFNRFSDRVKLLSKARERAEKETGESKDAFINVTAPDLKELEKRIELVYEHGFRYFMIDVVITGFTALNTATELAREKKMAIHGHRAMHAMFTRKNHGMSMYFLAKLCRLMGIDQIHTGTVLGKLEGDKTEVLAMRDMLLSEKTKGVKNLCFDQEWHGLKPTMPVVSGGLHPGILPEVLKLYNTDSLVLQVGGGVMGHPEGVYAGARAVKDAITAIHEGYTLEEYSKKSKYLASALKKWGHTKPV